MLLVVMSDYGGRLVYSMSCQFTQWHLPVTCNYLNTHLVNWLLCRQLIAIIKEIIGEVHEEDNENCNRIKWICKISIFIIAFVYGSVRDKLRLTECQLYYTRLPYLVI